MVFDRDWEGKQWGVTVEWAQSFNLQDEKSSGHEWLWWFTTLNIFTLISLKCTLRIIKIVSLMIILQQFKNF